MIFEKQVVNGFKGMMHTRCDDTETVFYYSPADFAGLKSEPYAFKSSMGHTLQGYIYSYENPIASRLIVFDHGFGSGHRAYMKEIEKLCAHGYRVFAYDHTGCMESGASSPNGLAQSLCDLNDCLVAIKADKQFEGVDISVMGHSWGAFSTLNIAALHQDVSHIVALCEFVAARAGDDYVRLRKPRLDAKRIEGVGERFRIAAEFALRNRVLRHGRKHLLQIRHVDGFVSLVEPTDVDARDICHCELLDGPLQLFAGKPLQHLPVMNKNYPPTIDHVAVRLDQPRTLLPRKLERLERVAWHAWGVRSVIALLADGPHDELITSVYRCYSETYRSGQH